MKNLAFALIFVCLNAAVVPSCAAEAKPDPSQYTLVVHVSASRYAQMVGASGASAINPNLLSEVLTATVGNRHYKLLGPTSSAKAFMHGNGLIDPGDYHARLTQDEHKTSYESAQQFEILLPDGATRRFTVIEQSE
jgi:hypothetical protein